MRRTAISSHRNLSAAQDGDSAKFNPEDIKRKHQNATVKEIIDDYLKAYEASGRRAIKDTKLRAGHWSEIFPNRAARSILPNDIEQARLELAKSQCVSNNKREPTKGQKLGNDQPLSGCFEGRVLFGRSKSESGEQSGEAHKVEQGK